MKKYFFLIICTTLIFHGLNAQRVNIDKLGFKVNSRRLPNKIMPPEYKSYSVHISATAALEAYTNQSFTDQINIVGLKKVPGRGHLNVNVDLGDLIIESSDVKERVEIQKDKNGKETGRTHYFHVEIVYTFSASADVVDYKTGSILERYSLARRDGQFNRNTFSTEEYNSYKSAADYYNNNSLELKTKFVREKVNGSLSSLNSSLNKDYGYPTDSQSPHLWYAGTKKHVEHDASLNACTSVQAAFSKVTPQDSLKGIKESIGDAISYFEKLTTVYTDKEEKEHKKLRYCSYYNLGMIYYYLEQPELAMTYAQKLIDNDYDPGDGKDLIKDCQEFMASLKRHNVTTRHFPIDLTNVEGPK